MFRSYSCKTFGKPNALAKGMNKSKSRIDVYKQPRFSQTICLLCHELKGKPRGNKADSDRQGHQQSRGRVSQCQCGWYDIIILCIICTQYILSYQFIQRRIESRNVRVHFALDSYPLIHPESSTHYLDTLESTTKFSLNWMIVVYYTI